MRRAAAALALIAVVSVAACSTAKPQAAPARPVTTSSPAVPTPAPNVTLSAVPIPDARADRAVCKELAEEQVGRLTFNQLNDWLVPQNAKPASFELVDPLILWLTDEQGNTAAAPTNLNIVVRECALIGVRA
jgi:hypothetical protein